MNESITIGRVRKPTTVSVPAGGWVLILGPDKPFGEHASKRGELLGATNDDFDKVCVGKLRNTHPDLRFLTTDQKVKVDKEMEETNKALVKSNLDAKARQKKMGEDEAAKAQAEHSKRIIDINKINDAIRTGAHLKTQ